MEKDIVPELLDLLEKEFNLKIKNDKLVLKLIEALEVNKATFKEANEYAIKLGELLAKVFEENLSAEILPDERMYYNIAERILNTTLENNYEKISNYAIKVAESLNLQAGIGLKSKQSKINQDRVDGLIERLVEFETFEEGVWILQEPIINFSQSIVDDIIKLNAEFHSDLGMQAKVTRNALGGCCDWCSSLSGTYEYPDVPDNVYKRHRFCRCTVDYHPRDGKIQNVHSKKWR